MRPMAKLVSWSKRCDGWGVVVHGGAGDVDAERGPLHAAGCRSAVERTVRALREGASALDAACLAVEMLEDNPLYNAGTGAALDEAGELSLDASVMCGKTLRAGAVCALPAFQHPVAIARAILDDGLRVLLAGDGAAVWAEKHGFSKAEAASMITDAARARLASVRTSGESGAWAGGTVGCVVRDRRGSLVAATSTGGMVGKPKGRIGDSAIIGAGTYADDAAGAVSNTGDGEAFLRAVAAKMAVETMRSGASCSEAVGFVLQDIALRLNGLGGTIAIDALGSVSWGRTTRTMSWAAAAEDWDTIHEGF